MLFTTPFGAGVSGSGRLSTGARPSARPVCGLHSSPGGPVAGRPHVCRRGRADGEENRKAALTGRGWVGAGNDVQRVPFQCSVSVLSPPAALATPTAQTSSGASDVMANGSPPRMRGAVTRSQRSPFQCSMSCPPYSSAPAAHTSARPDAEIDQRSAPAGIGACATRQLRPSQCSMKAPFRPPSSPVKKSPVAHASCPVTTATT